VAHLIADRGLQSALSKGDVNSVLLFREAGGAVSDTQGAVVSQTKEFHVALLNASSKGETAKLDHLLRLGLNPNLADRSGWTGLIQAAVGNQLAAARLLLTAGADVNQAESDGWTPLMFAVYYGNNDIVALLLERGADANKMSKRGQTAFILAESMQRDTALRLLSDTKSRPATPASQAETIREFEVEANYAGVEAARANETAQDIDLAKLRASIAAGADPNQLHESGWTPLTYAAAAGDCELINELIKAGADPNLREPQGWTALMFAAYEDRWQCLEVLFQAGADPFAPTSDNFTAAEIAFENDYQHTAQLIADYALRLALSRRDLHQVLMLVGAGGNPDIADDRGSTGMSLAIELEDLGAVKYLLAHGADVNLVKEGGVGLTPLTMAAMRGQLETVNLLIAAGSNCRATNDRGETAESLAAAGGHEAVVAVIRRCKAMKDEEEAAASLAQEGEDARRRRLEAQRQAELERERQADAEAQMRRAADEEARLKHARRTEAEKAKALAEYGRQAKERAVREREAREAARFGAEGRVGIFGYLYKLLI